MLLPLTDENFESILADAKIPIVIMVSASWCFPCRTLKPLVEKLHVQYQDRVAFYLCDSDESQKTCGKLAVSAIPTLIFITNKFSVKKPAPLDSRLVGVNSEKAMRTKIEEMLI
jgi:thioredoxin-like negative regulator of GroEL